MRAAAFARKCAVRPGYLALILHAHLPFVRHPEHDDSFEEEWLFEAITETYIPLIGMMQRLLREGVPCKLAISITPPLCAMLADELLRNRYLRHLSRSINLAGREIERNRDHPQLEELARFYYNLFTETHRVYAEELQCDLLSAFRQLRDAGALEIVASAATHGLLPLLAQSPSALRAQVLLGCDSYRETFDADPAGFWLPECAFVPDLEHVLQEANIRWFVVDAHAFALARPRPTRAIFAPCFTPAGPAAFARDPESSRQVWSAEAGYPGDAAYRDFYRDIGFDLPPTEAFADSTLKAPRFTGLKYHRVTGRGCEKQLYNRESAEAVASTHAEHFLAARRAQFLELPEVDFAPIVTMPFDAELFGHWWFEGPLFLETFIRKAAAGTPELQLTTPAEYLGAYSTHEVTEPAGSSWGDGGYWGVWLDERNAWIYPHLHAAAARMNEAALAHRMGASPIVERILRQLARELLLAQSSDWAFLMRSGTASEYATQRTVDHLQRFSSLFTQVQSGSIDERYLAECESRDNLFPNVEWRRYL